MIALLDPQDRDSFPDARHALREPNGLLAVGGDLTPARLQNAYRRGIFPWFNPGDPILWWSPDPRTVLFPTQLRISRSLAKRLRQQPFAVTLDRAFHEVLCGCAAPREPQGGTWLIPEMIAAYEVLHARGLAHSVEVWQDQHLVGGLYGVAIGRAFFGESMFTRVTDASKVALVQLCRQLEGWNFGLIDCQMRTDHLIRMGAIEMPRVDFLNLLNRFCPLPGRHFSWDDGRREGCVAPLPDDPPSPKAPQAHSGSP
ncbi:leucyl/phenylalanyl-tRNA--protein transferase [Thiocystis minor]|uniref:leucyl/phenylalanyl-tRNA--protein transferase n=1 Tax=Thiocystis minor TaxID=61597 RepID=UPI00191401EA|nr:leucyl/phenylalanyl-tRNA--protein transferase [Thiocystis minor]MBK5964434.1 leucyl/phenylalanyl-tRNA--protein transferase [Thiocystis minor]